jgi:hypothetical protein
MHPLNTDNWNIHSRISIKLSASWPSGFYSQIFADMDILAIPNYTLSKKEIDYTKIEYKFTILNFLTNIFQKEKKKFDNCHFIISLYLNTNFNFLFKLVHWPYGARVSRNTIHILRAGPEQGQGQVSLQLWASKFWGLNFF